MFPELKEKRCYYYFLHTQRTTLLNSNKRPDADRSIETAASADS